MRKFIRFSTLAIVLFFVLIPIYKTNAQLIIRAEYMDGQNKIKYSGVGLPNSITEVDISTELSPANGFTATVITTPATTSGSFYYEQPISFSGTYVYIIYAGGTETEIDSGTVVVPPSSSGTNTGGTSGTNTGSNNDGANTGGSSGTNTGGSSGTDTGGSSGTNTGGSSGTDTGGSSGTNTGGSSGTDTGGSSGGSAPSNPILLENPLKGIGTLPELIEAILEIILKIGTWVLAGFIIYTGYMFVAARGNPAELEKAKASLKYTLLGGAILLGAWVIAEAIVGTVNALK